MNILREEFINFLVENDRSKNTIDSYISDLEKFTYDELTTETIKQYVIDLQTPGPKTSSTKKKKGDNEKKGLKIATINRKMVSIKQYIKFLAEDKGIVINPKVRQLKQQKSNYLDNVLTDKDFASMINSAEKKEDIRAKAIFSTLAWTGLRVSEMLQLKISDISSDALNICGKGEKNREMFISKKLQVVLKEYAAVRIQNSDMLFTGARGPINRQTVDKVIKQHASFIRLKKEKAHAHNFRHYFCKMALEKGLSLNTVADLVGHSDINTTRIYTKQTKDELKNAINQL